MKTTPILMLLFFIAFYSCQKELGTTSDNTTPQNEEKVEEYLTEENFRLGPVVMFTKNNEITDTNIIKKYLQDHSRTTFFQFSGSQQATYVYRVKISSLGKDSMQYEWPARPGEYFTPYKPLETLSKSDTQVLVKATDSLTLRYSGNPLLHSDTVYQNAFKVLPSEMVCGIKVEGSLQTYECKGRQIIPVNIRNNEMYIPFFTFFHVDLSRPTGGSSRLVGDIRNIFDPKVRSFMYANDTIVYQGKELKLIKQ
jgi:hypothetical protein